MTEPFLSRRAFVAGTAALTLGARLRRAAPGTLLHVGTYTVDTGSKGVYGFRMDADSGALQPVGAWDVGRNPSFLAVSGRTLLAVNEVDDYEGGHTGAVSASAAARGDGALAVRGAVASRGQSPCYVSIDRTGRCALVANYSSGTVAAFPLHPDGRLGAATSVMQHEGHGPDASRQQGPHAHCIIPDPSNRWALAADLGVDRVFVYRLDPKAATLTAAPTPFVALPPGAGPRHLAFDPSGRTLFVVTELDMMLASFRWDAQRGTLAPLHRVPLAPGLVRGQHTGADLHVAPSGRFVYASVRGDDSIVVFSVDAKTGALAPVQHVPTGGRWPRNFALDPSGRFLLVANQKSNDITRFRVDQGTGRLAPAGDRVEVPAPVCIRFGA